MVDSDLLRTHTQPELTMIALPMHPISFFLGVDYAYFPLWGKQITSHVSRTLKQAEMNCGKLKKQVRQLKLLLRNTINRSIESTAI